MDCSFLFVPCQRTNAAALSLNSQLLTSFLKPNNLDNLDNIILKQFKVEWDSQENKSTKSCYSKAVWTLVSFQTASGNHNIIQEQTT